MVYYDESRLEEKVDDTAPKQRKMSFRQEAVFGLMVFPSMIAPFIYGGSDAMDPGMHYREWVLPAALLPYLGFMPKKAQESFAKKLVFKAAAIGAGAVIEGASYLAGYGLGAVIDRIF